MLFPKSFLQKIFFIWSIIISIHSLSQSKKEKIIILTNRVDSLIEEINLNKNVIKTKNQTITDLNKNISELKMKLSDCNSLNDIKQERNEVLKDKINKLVDSIAKLNHPYPKKFQFPYQYGDKVFIGNTNYSTFYFDSRKDFQIITDSLVVEFNHNEIFHFYFFTPITESLNTQCPEEFGYLVLNNEGKKVYQIFDNSGNIENSFYKYQEYDLTTKKRRLLGLLSTGCGSGGTITYYELELLNGELIQKPKITVSVGGYKTTYFLTEEEKYVELIRINPDAHWSGDTRYKLNFYDLNNDKKIATKQTKYIYPHYGDIDYKLLDLIKKREPNVWNTNKK